MGGEGSMQHMINTLRNNKSMLRRKSMFKKERTFLSTRKEYYRAAKGKVNLKNATKEELLQLRKKIIKRRKVENIRAWAIVLVILVPAIILGVDLLNKEEKIETNETVNEEYLIDNLNEYTYLIEEGDKWIAKKNWNNAIYRYEQAVKLFPEELEANYRLALAYSYSCKYTHKNCEIGNALAGKLLKFFPENQDVLELQKIFEK